ncbi:MAG TPA: hypothetical protein DEB10_11845 [Ruminococcaceae bacterium]|nr:hypothetical protein [Oscillospiraceae bacterium]HCA28956.1 hypothetical protein [Oscillospiraceae bacterium]
MFNRPYIKELAKYRMSGRMGNAIIVALLVTILGGQASSGFTFRFNQINQNGHNILMTFFPLFAFLGFFAIAYSILVGNVISIGTKGWFLRYWRGENVPVGEMFVGFKHYSAFVTTGLLKGVYIFLWSLLFVIPGIVMGYAYSMTEYILCEYPHLSASQAIDISRRMTYGHKADLFVFDLSYIGWWMLTAMTFGILGIVYVTPYYNTAHAGVYETLKHQALQRGVLRPEDFGMMAPPPAPPYNQGGYQQY